MATHPKVLGVTLDPKPTYNTHMHNISVHAHTFLQQIKNPYGRLLHPRPSLTMQNVALRTATGCTQDTTMQHLHDEILAIHHISYTYIQHTSTLQGKEKFTIFNNGRYTTNIPNQPHIVTTTDIKNKYAPYTHIYCHHTSKHKGQ